MDYERYKNKKVNLTTYKDYYYTGIIKAVDEDSVLILDKFNKEVTIKKNDIKLLVEK